ncbi:uncharacterized protein LOC113797257 [Dermatophagoides pteronyssinus]|uniref:uncharacterized protein LOC113797257 n=1 Tax=Dermatophagoides pteronyssinus TaxID=6956 RepID=UPI003F6677C8
MMKYLLILSAIISLSHGQHSLSQAGQAQYYTPPTPSTSATLGQAYSLSPQQLAQPIRVYGSAPNAGYASAASPAQYSQYSAQPQPQAAAVSPYAGLGLTASAVQAQAQAQAQAAAAAAVPSNYGWQVQHQALQPQPQQSQPQSHPQALAAPQVSAYQTGAPAHAPAPAAVAPTPLHRPASVHYAQIGENLAGDYRFGYRTGDGNSFREESRLPDGTVQGQYGFVDADGKQRLVKYQAGVGGFQVLGSGEGAAAAAAPASVPAYHSAPVARSVGSSAAVSVPAIPQWAQSHIGGTIPAAAAAPRPQSQPQYAQYAQQQYSSPAVASSSPGVPAQHTTTLQLGPGGAQFASSAAAGNHQPNTLTIRPIAAIAVRAGSSTGAAIQQSYGQPSATQPQTWGSHLG